MNQRVNALKEAQSYVNQYRNETFNFLFRLRDLDRKFLLRSDIEDVFALVCSEDTTGTLTASPLATMVTRIQEAAIAQTWMVFALRIRVARWEYVRVHVETLQLEYINVSEFLAFKERRSPEWVHPDLRIEGRL